MVIEKPKSIRSNKKNQLPSLGINVDIRTLNILCRYVLSSSSYVRIAHLSNLKKFIYEINPETYANDPEKIKRIRFLKAAIDARLDNNLNNIDMVLNHILTRIDFNVDFVDFEKIEMDSNEVQWCHKLVADSLQYYFVYDAADKMIDLCTRIKTSSYEQRGELIKEFQNEIDTLKNEFRVSQIDDNLTDMVFSLKNGLFENAITETYNLVTNPSRRLICGMQGLNEMVGGGFESGRVYMLLGITGVGKSVSLLNLLYQLKRYNTNYKTKDPTKTPCIVLLTMENTVVETITRLFDLAVPMGNGLGACGSAEEAINTMRSDGQLFINNDSPIDMVIKFKPNKSVDTSYLYEMTDNLEDQGYEVICVIQDHVKRIRSIYNSPDLRIELGDIVNEFKVFASLKDIPVISVCHLNRDAAKIVEEGKSKTSPTDITMKLGKSNVGESLLMMDNIDCAIIINQEFDKDNNLYMVYNLIKMRDKTSRTYIAQPFMYGSTIRMVEDVGGVPMFKESLHMNKDINRISSIRTSSATVMSNITDIMATQQSDNAFNITDNDIYAFNEEQIDNNAPKEEIPVIRHQNIVCPLFFVNQPTNKPDLGKLKELKAKLKEKVS